MLYEVITLKANPKRAALGAVIEAKLDIGRGPVATVLVQNGTLKRGDIFVVGEQWGKVRALINDHGDRVDEAGPSVPVEVLGLNGTPEAGDVLNVVETEAQAREIADYRIQAAKDKLAASCAATTLEHVITSYSIHYTKLYEGQKRTASAFLYPPVEAFDQRMIEVGHGHRIYVEQSGHPHGRPRNNFV